MNFPTWGDLFDYHCSRKRIGTTKHTWENPYFEQISARRYNYSAEDDTSRCRLIFLKSVLKNPTNKTLIRNGRFIWCKNFHYEGRNKSGLRQISFTVDQGQTRFIASEHQILCLPSKTFVNNNSFFRPPEKTFLPFCSVFNYSRVIKIMQDNSSLNAEEFLELLADDNPHKVGSLVSPRLGFFVPARSSRLQHHGRLHEEHPCGIILGPSFEGDDYLGREFYRVRFGDTTYERVHPVQMEVINEV